MRRFLLSTAAGLLTLTLITPLQATPPKGYSKSSSGSHPVSPYKLSSPHFPHYPSKNQFKFSGVKNLNYTHKYWCSKWNCYYYWCPTDCCWYYWYPACGCYYPIEYITFYPPCQVVEVVNVVPVVVQTLPVVYATPSVVGTTVPSQVGPPAPGPMPPAPPDPTTPH